MAEYLYPVAGTYATVRKIYPELKYYKPREYVNVSRYNEVLRLFDDINGVYYHETLTKQEIPQSETDKYITVTSKYENRLDVLANDVYGYSLYWWIIARANELVDPFDVPCGTVLRCPPVISLYTRNNTII